MTYKAAQVYTGSEWVDLAVAIADPHQRQLVTVTGTTDTFVLSDGGKAKIYTNSSAVAVTIPTNASVAFTLGQTLVIVQYGAGVVTISGDSGVTVRTRGSRNKTNGQYAEARLTKLGTDEWLLSGDVTS
jgi:hypothetical protein